MNSEETYNIHKLVYLFINSVFGFEIQREFRRSLFVKSCTIYIVVDTLLTSYDALQQKQNYIKQQGNYSSFN